MQLHPAPVLASASVHPVSGMHGAHCVHPLVGTGTPQLVHSMAPALLQTQDKPHCALSGPASLQVTPGAHPTPGAQSGGSGQVLEHW
jgi:hypothetical protein